MHLKIIVYSTFFVLPLISCPILHSQVVQDWVSNYPGWYAAGVVTDAEGNSYVTGPTFADAAHAFRSDIIVVKYNQQGAMLWSREFDEPDDGTNGTDVSNWITIDPSGNILITGTSFLNSTGDNFITLKYDADGNLIWKARSTAGIEASRVETDGSGNVYVMGPSSTVASARNYVTIKYDADGNQLWTRTYNGPNSFDDTPLSLAVTTDGMVAVTGTSTGGITSFDIATIVYDTDGNQLWVRRYNLTDRSDAGRDVAFGTSGEVYVAGYVFDDVAFSTDGVVLKYDPDGNEEWVRFHNPADRPDVFSRLRVDTEGNVVAAGYSQQADLAFEFVTAKYDPDGNVLWVESVNLGGNILVWNMALGADNAVYVTGESNQNIATFKYSSDGVLQWSQAYDSGGFPDRGYGIALDPSAGVIVVGQSPFVTIRYVEESQRIDFAPVSFLVTRGTYVSGGVAELADSDNADFTVQRSSLDTQSRTEFEVKAVSPVASPSSLEVTLEGSVFARSQVIQTIELFDYDAGAWELIDSREANRFSDSTVVVVATGDLSRFVQPDTNCIEARIHFQSPSQRQQFSSNTDQFLWTIGN